ncbi:MAG: hypothetical protein LUE14_01920 [Clostridiales bacterium]|nr:hypothetical protein [Clostridiales bacterium]
MLAGKKMASIFCVVCLMVLSIAGCSSSTATSSETGTTESGSHSDGSGSSYSEITTDASSDSSGTYFPDPGTVLGVEGEFYMSEENDDGIMFEYYVYDFEATTSTVGSFMVTYGEAMKNLGFTIKNLTLSSSANMYNKRFEKNDEFAELSVCVTSSSDDSTVTEDTLISWRMVLAVPESMSFTLGGSVPGVVNGNTVCVGCGGTGNCSGCGGTGRANYGDGYETCILCNGTGICNVCDGAGSY